MTDVPAKIYMKYVIFLLIQYFALCISSEMNFSPQIRPIYYLESTTKFGTIVSIMFHLKYWDRHSFPNQYKKVSNVDGMISARRMAAGREP